MIERLRGEIESWKALVLTHEAEIERLRAAGYEVTGKDGWFNARNAIIEECAIVVDGWRRGYGLKPLAEAIRALKDKP